MGYLCGRRQRGEGRCSKEEVGNLTAKNGELGKGFNDRILLQDLRRLIGGSIDQDQTAPAID
jgi:hypothetical protein